MLRIILLFQFLIFSQMSTAQVADEKSNIQIEALENSEIDILAPYGYFRCDYTAHLESYRNFKFTEFKNLIISLINLYKNDQTNLEIVLNHIKTRNLLILAIRREDFKFATYLTEKGVNIQAINYKKLFPHLVNYGTSNILVPIVEAVSNNAANEFVKLLIEKGADPKVKESVAGNLKIKGDDLYTQSSAYELAIATYPKYLEVFSRNTKIKPTSVDLYNAIRYGTVDAVKWILDQKTIDLNNTFYREEAKQNALHLIFMDIGHDFSKKPENFIWYVINRAHGPSQESGFKIAKLLISAGIDLSYRDNYGRTATNYLSFTQKIKLIDRLENE